VNIAVLPPSLVLDPLLRKWLLGYWSGRSHDTGFTSHRGKWEKARGYLKPQASLACQLRQECFNFWANKPASLLLLLRVNGVIRQVVAGSRFLNAL